MMHHPDQPPNPPTPPRRVAGPIAGRIARRITRLAGWLLTSLGVVLLIAWLTGRLASDRWLWSQWLFWAVTPAGGIPSGLTLLVGALFFRRAGAPGARWARGPCGRRPRRVLPLLALAILLWTPIIGWRAWAWPLRAVLGAPESDLRVLHWNPAGKRPADLAGALAPHRPDLVVISNPPTRVPWSEVGRRLFPGGDDATLGQCRILSRYPVLRWGRTSLGLVDLHDPPENGEPARRSELPQPGWAAWVELDTAEALGRPLVVWVVDLPSSPDVPRREVALRARQAIEAWNGPVMESPEPGAGGRPRPDLPDPPGFPGADLIVGDFNSPRGAWSASWIAGALRPAYGDLGPGGGIGRCATWPRERPLYHLDKAFIGRWLRSCRYQIADPGETPHRMQLIDLKARD